MVFSNIVFIYLFLPIALLLYYIAGIKGLKAKNYMLLFLSLCFYIYGEPELIIVLLVSIVVNYIVGLFLDRPYKKIVLFLGLAYNVLVLVFFKYTNFFISNANGLFNLDIELLNIAMPLGISFYTFQAISYLVESYRDEELIENNILDLALYIAMFPQLISGPIVRYDDMAGQIKYREESISDFSYGINRFVIGLAKKVLLADSLSKISDYVFSTGELTTILAWFGAFIYSLQIYYDFSGYSDMAIGIARMFGFKIKENFDDPYISDSITDFWRRWHISLSSWFRDYVYIPLGGNRKGMGRQIFNILVVWLLTGFWHGAQWNFIIWGLYFAILLIIEKVFLLKKLNNFKVLNHIYALFFIIIGWMIFRAESIDQIFAFLQTMFSFDFGSDQRIIYFLRQYGLEILLALVLCLPWKNKLRKTKRSQLIMIPVLVLLLLVSTSAILQGSFSPFIYF